MRNWIVALSIALLAGRVSAEEFELFRASDAGEQAWSWGAARIRAKEGVLRITENSPTNDAGDVTVADMFPNLASGKITLDVSKVSLGNYTLQILCFKQGVYFHTAEPISHAKATNQYSFTLGTLGLPPETDGIRFKIWVAGAELASIDVKELTYSDNIDLSHAFLDDRFDDATKWEADAGKVAFAALDTGAKLSVLKGAGFGSITRQDTFSKEPGQEILFNVASATSCTLTVQLNVFDSAGAFMQAIDVISTVGAGPHSVRLDTVKWPEGGSSFNTKIWIGGEDLASAELRRLIIFKR